ncbi:spindle pole body component 110-like [Toxotes jaculatrix]|uniref:spindle pole body component 110-like n=1 Tax=Toxotes jaculatrix TaxID=941984 RepID=UPI001B3ADA0A|nr:spindle pole body component 110-like [Toxotes jaculatrix]
MVERDNANKNLFKAQEQITEKIKTLLQKDQEIQNVLCEVNKKKAELAEIKRKYYSVKNQLERVKTELSETKTTQGTALVSADKDINLLKKTLAKVDEEKEELARKLKKCKDLVGKQEKKILLQSSKQEVSDTENVKKEYGMQVNELDKKKSKFNLVKLFLVVTKEKCECATRKKKQKLQLEEKDKEIEDLKHKLKDALQKLKKCQWSHRRFEEKLKASIGMQIFLKKYDESQKEEIERLKDELRKLKVDSFLKSKETHLPPLFKKPQHPSEDISRSKRFPITTTFPKHHQVLSLTGYKSYATKKLSQLLQQKDRKQTPARRLEVAKLTNEAKEREFLVDKSQHQFEEKVKTAPLPPIHRKQSCTAVGNLQMNPRPSLSLL